MIFYRNQKKLNVIFMSYKDNLLYVQKQTNFILQSHKYFVKAYIDNIIIFNRTLKKHLKHLRIIFELFRSKKN